MVSLSDRLTMLTFYHGFLTNVFVQSFIVHACTLKGKQFVMVENKNTSKNSDAVFARLLTLKGNT